MNNYIVILVDGHLDRFMRKCLSHQLSLLEINYLSEEQMLVKIDFKDLKAVKRLNYYSKVKIIKYGGFNGFKRYLKNNLFIYLIILLSFILMDIMTSYIVRVDIIHENSGIRKLVANELKELKISAFSLAKDFDELETIKNQILKNNPTKLEWLSITRVGMTYVVRIEERILTDTTKETGFAHIISNKDALITKITSTSGNVLVRSGEYVRKGDILISGAIMVGEAVKGNTLATGEIYGDVWYEVDIDYPINYEHKTFTNKKRWNLTFNNKILFRNKYQYFEQKNIRRFKILGIKLAFYEEAEYKLNKGKYTNKEVINLALTKAAEEVNKKLNGQGQVISKKVLQKEENNSTISMRVFIVTNELISTREYYTPGSEANDSSNRD